MSDDLDEICDLIETDDDIARDLERWYLDVELRRITGISLDTVLMWAAEIE